METAEFRTLLQFFKALANENRLKIVSVLVDRECSVEELATLLHLKAPTVSHHLGILKELGLVDMRTDGNDHLHRLNTAALQTMSIEVLHSLDADAVGALVDDSARDAWERKVLNTFLEQDRIKAIPAGYKKRLVVLKWLIGHFNEGVRYSEREVNEIIARHHPDYCSLRREFIVNGLMQRENGVYWRIEWQMPDLSS